MRDESPPNSFTDEETVKLILRAKLASELQFEINKLSNEKARSLEEIAKLRQQLSQEKARSLEEIAKLQQEADLLKQKSQIDSIETVLLKEKVAFLQDQLKKVEEHWIKSEDDQNKQTLILEKKDRELKRAQSEIESIKTRLEESKAAREELNKKNSGIYAELNDKIKKLDETEAKLVRLNYEVSRLTNKRSEDKALFESQIGQLKLDKESFGSRINHLITELEQLKQGVDVSKQEVQKLKNDNKDLEDILTLNSSRNKGIILKFNNKFEQLTKELEAKSIAAKRINLKRTLITVGATLFFGFFSYEGIQWFNDRSERQKWELLTTDISDLTVAKRLHELLLNKDPNERLSAAQGIFKDPSPQYLPALLYGLKTEQNQVVKINIIRDLGEIGDKCALSELTTLSITSGDPFVKQAAEEAIGNITETARKASARRESVFRESRESYKKQVDDLTLKLKEQSKQYRDREAERQSIMEETTELMDKDVKKIKPPPNIKELQKKTFPLKNKQ